VRADLVNAVLLAATDILKAETGLRVDRGHPSIQTDPHTTQEVTATVALGAEGLTAAIILGMSERTAANVAQAILKQDCDALDELPRSCIAELGNTIGIVARSTSRGHCGTLSVASDGLSSRWLGAPWPCLPDW
jgi:CheY-specific phosphatase CheX